MIEHLDPRVDHYELAPASSDDDVRTTCRAFGFEPSEELLDFARDLGGHGFGYTSLSGVEGQDLNLIYSFAPDEEVKNTVLRARTLHDQPGVLPGYMPIADCNGNELWLRIADGQVLLWDHDSWKTEEELAPVAASLTELVSGIEPDE